MITLRGVSKTVSSGGQPLTILHPLDLAVKAGERLAIVGPSGSGKSTLIGLMAGLDQPTTGEILIDGTDITRLGEDALARLRGRTIGFIFQSHNLLPTLTARENVEVPMYEMPLRAGQRRERAQVGDEREQHQADEDDRQGHAARQVAVHRGEVVAEVAVRADRLQRHALREQDLL